ncbi:hypothetical protein KDA11_05165, partial [Candidatus Saccharibacteria bacterium]|nr:hypothetical protein [Candidatus Saccharibacteria bacterium]
MEVLQSLSSAELVQRLSAIRGKEREVISELIRYLAEVDSRQYYRECGYSSLFAFCIGYLGYSEPATQRRILAARAHRVDSRVCELIKSGAVSLSAVSAISKLLVQTADTQLVSSIIGKTRSEAELVAIEYVRPRGEDKQEEQVSKVKSNSYRKARLKPKKRQLDQELPLFSKPVEQEQQTETEYSLSLTVDKEFVELLEQLKRISGAAGFDDVESLKRSMREYIRKNSP